MIYQSFQSVNKTTSLSHLLSLLDIDSSPVYRTPAQWRIVMAALRCCRTGGQAVMINHNSGTVVLFSGYTYRQTRFAEKLSVQACIDISSVSDPLPLWATDILRKNV
jgi:hypothetical protein